MTRLILVVALLLGTGLGAGRFGAARDPAADSLWADPPQVTSASPGAMPETLLALIGNDRSVTRSTFLRAWRQSGSGTPLESSTPEMLRQFLGLLVDREVLGQAAARESWVWTAAESAQYRALRDRLMMRAMLDSALVGTRAEMLSAGDASPDPEALRIAARDRAVAEMAVALDEDLLARLAAAWAAILRPEPGSPLSAQLAAMAAMPEIAPSDAGRAVARTSLGEHRVIDVLESWGRLSPELRPRIETVDQMRELVWNGIFERSLRHQAQARRLDDRPDIASALSEERERIGISHLLAREVEGMMTRDSLLALRYFLEHPDEWALPTRVRAIRLAAANRTDAARMAARLRDPAEAERLAREAMRSGLDYVVVASAESDSALFSAALRAGPGAVIGPERTTEDWWVARVTEILPARMRRFEEVREEVEERASRDQAERLLRSLCDRLRRSTKVVVNGRALDRMREGDDPRR